MSTVPRLISHYGRQVELTIKSKPTVEYYQIGAANTLDTAWAGTTAMFRVPRDGTFRSPYIRQKRWGRTQNNNRGLTWMLYDPEDYWSLAPAAMPHDSDIAYLRVAEVSPVGVVGPEGPVLVLPPAGFFSTPRPRLVVVGTAPVAAAAPNLLPPPGSMRFILPRFADYVDIRNQDVANPMYVSYGTGLPEVEIPPSDSRAHFDAAFEEIYVRSTGGPVAFDMHFAIVNGEMA